MCSKHLGVGWYNVIKVKTQRLAEFLTPAGLMHSAILTLKNKHQTPPTTAKGTGLTTNRGGFNPGITTY